MIRGVVLTGSLNNIQMCHAIASPSRSSSVAKTTLFAFLISAFILEICLDFSLIVVKVGLKLLLISISFKPFS